MVGKVYGVWRVAAIIDAKPWPYAWLVHVGNPMVQARFAPVERLHELTVQVRHELPSGPSWKRHAHMAQYPQQSIID